MRCETRSWERPISLRRPRWSTAWLRSSPTSRRAKTLRFRVPADEAARLMLTVWESEAVRAAMAGLDYEALCRRTSQELARVAQLIIEAPED